MPLILNKFCKNLLQPVVGEAKELVRMTAHHPKSPQQIEKNLTFVACIELLPQLLILQIPGVKREDE